MAITISGLDEAIELLDKAPKNIVMLGYARAARAAMNVVAAGLAVKTPIQKGAAKSSGDLAKALKIDVTVDSSARGVAAYVGFAGEQATVAYALEYGHTIVTHEGKRLGEAPAHPFMRPAFDGSADAAVEAFADSLAETLKEAY
jgi:HK97 gp10 family phage protein